MKKTALTATLLSALISGSALAGPAPFGAAEDLAYADQLWSAMRDAKLVGPGRVMSTPYTGTHPHGAILDTIDSSIAVGDLRGPVIIKNNYGGDGVTKAQVADNPDAFLKAVTVMFKRQGYDPETRDWFWVKYGVDGKPLTNPKGVALAGRVGKGGDQGCVACHKAAPGGDLVFNNDRFK